MRVHHSPHLKSLKKISGILLVGGIVFGSLLIFPVQSRGASPERTTPGVRPVPDSVLAGMRGGFSWGGINFSFGIESSTFVNGALMVKTILQTIGNELLVETGSNPFQGSTGNGTPQVSATVSASTDSVSKNNVLTPNSGGGQPGTNTISSPSLTVSSSSSTPPGVTIRSVPAGSGSQAGNAFSYVVQIEPSGSGNTVKNLVSPTAFDNSSGIISVLQNAASNLVIHNVVTMNGTATNIGAVTHALSLNSMLEASRFLER
jgi:hypothetical protein